MVGGTRTRGAGIGKLSMNSQGKISSGSICAFCIAVHIIFDLMNPNPSFKVKSLRRVKMVIGIFLCCFFLNPRLQAQATERFRQNQTYDLPSLIEEYQKLDAAYEEAKLITLGQTDVGKDLHLFLIDRKKQFNPIQNKADKRVFLLINNGIHPGEPCGVDASLKFAHELLSNKKYSEILQDVVVGIIPMYNVGGGLNRACCSRANQNGPIEAGFRGNGRNLDLNRDFIKADAKNTWLLQNVVVKWDPDVFIDTHTSNGADYQYDMTLISSQSDKLFPLLGKYQRTTLDPAIFAKMEKKGFPMSPYVHSLKQIPDSGIYDFLETPRYSTGYTALFNAFSFVSEAHMLKSFEARVLATHALLHSLVETCSENRLQILSTRQSTQKILSTAKQFPLHWQLDTNVFETITFKGYEAKYKKSEVTGAERLYYDQKKPYEKNIKYYNRYFFDKEAAAPSFYVLPQVWWQVADRLKNNGVQLVPLERDTNMLLEVSYIKDYKSLNRPYEGHYLHYDVEVSKEEQLIDLYKGDYLIPVNQFSNRFIVETLEPEGEDSFFAWNFFDEILQQKEWYSSYVFEDVAAKLLVEDPEIKKAFEEKKSSDSEFANNPKAQLFFIYKQSDYYEKSHLRYPVYRVR
ncbi:MAG TPA: hypothetical protein DCS15_10320 [Flavobacteriales bacterium]|nr:hypothetical protein [Flavobacteriales bacterium]